MGNDCSEMRPLYSSSNSRMALIYDPYPPPRPYSGRVVSTWHSARILVSFFNRGIMIPVYDQGDGAEWRGGHATPCQEKAHGFCEPQRPGHVGSPANRQGNCRVRGG